MTNGGFQSSWGKAYKYLPLKITFLASIGVFELGSLVSGAAPNSTALIIGRAIQGLGASGIGTGAYTIIAFVAEPSKRAAMTGTVGFAYGLAVVLGPIVGGALADHLSWRWCFYINLPLGAISVIIILFSFRTPSSAKPIQATWRETLLQMDFAGVAIMIGVLVSFTLALQYGGQTKAWSSSTVIGLIVGCIAIAIVFCIWEYAQGDRAMIPFRLIRQRPIGVSCTYTYFFAGSYYMAIYYLPIYFQSIDGVSATMSGIRNLPLILAAAVTMIVSGFIISANGLFAAPIMVGGAAIATIAAGLLYTLDTDTASSAWIGFQVIAGVGWGFAFQVPIIVCQSSVAATDISSATAMVLFFMNLGATTFVSAAQCAFVNRMAGALSRTAPGVDAAVVVLTGATEIRSKFSADQVPGIVEAYMIGIKVAPAIAIGGTGAAFVVSLFNSWRSLNVGLVKEVGSAG